MDSGSDSRFDPNFNAQVLADMSHERSLDAVLDLLVSRLGEREEICALQIWLYEPGAKSLCLVRQSGKLPSGIEALGSRISVGVGLLGEIAANLQHLVVRDNEPQWSRVADPACLQASGIRAFMGGAIAFKGELLGLTAAFFDHYPPYAAHAWNRIFANHIGSAIANARAFEEIQRLKARLEEQNEYLEEEVVEARAFGELVGASAALRHIVNQIDLVAATEASVLILGETGTGKELVAREIHRRSPRREKPLVRVNCASIPKDLFESEFFGHVKGAFTGAIKDRAGRFETAHGGTIFLDEVGEIPLDMQSKLLRVLQEKRYERVGDDRTRFADVRVVAATNRDLKKEAAARRFREDLYYRLNVFPIQVPSLRERLEDIPLLAQHFIELSSRELKCPKPRLPQSAIPKLQNYDWPGNIRELRNVIERAVILAGGKVLDFNLPISALAAPSAAQKSSATTAPGRFLTKPEIQRIERDNLLLVLEAANWKIKGPDGAAELFGIKPTTLLSKMEKWGLKKPGSERATQDTAPADRRERP